MALSVYKKGQGTAARGLAGVAAVLLGAWAGHQMWFTLYQAHKVVQIVGTALAVGVFAGVPFYLILFHHQAVDILIETQQEMRKVAWSSRAEVIGSTTVVIFTVALLAVFILGTDSVVVLIFRLIRLLR